MVYNTPIILIVLSIVAIVSLKKSIKRSNSSSFVISMCAISSYISILFAISINVIVVDVINMPTNTINVLYSSGWYSLMFILWQLFHDFIMLDITSININDNICRDIASINVILFILSEFKGYETINTPSIKHGYICYITI